MVSKHRPQDAEDNTTKFTSIRLTIETAHKLRKLVANMKAADPEEIHTTDDVVALLIDRHGSGATGVLDSSLLRWQNRLSDNVAREGRVAHELIGDHVKRAVKQLREQYRGEPKMILVNATDEVVIACGEALGLPVKDMRDSRCLPQGDACFYVGDRAARWYKERKQRYGQKAAEKFEERTPPDLVVEIGIEDIPHDAGAPGRYAQQGVREMWCATSRPDTSRVEIRILDLAAPDRPTVGESAVLPGLTAAFLPETLHMAATGRMEELGKLLGELPEPAAAQR